MSFAQKSINIKQPEKLRIGFMYEQAKFTLPVTAKIPGKVSILVFISLNCIDWLSILIYLLKVTLVVPSLVFSGLSREA